MWFTKEEAQNIANSDGVIVVLKQAIVKLHTTWSSENLMLNVSYGIWLDTKFGDNVIVDLVDAWQVARSFNDEGLGLVPSGWNGHCQDGWDYN